MIISVTSTLLEHMCDYIDITGIRCSRTTSWPVSALHIVDQELLLPNCPSCSATKILDLIPPDIADVRYKPVSGYDEVGSNHIPYVVELIKIQALLSAMEGKDPEDVLHRYRIARQDLMNGI